MVFQPCAVARREDEAVRRHSNHLEVVDKALDHTCLYPLLHSQHRKGWQGHRSQMAPSGCFQGIPYRAPFGFDILVAGLCHTFDRDQGARRAGDAHMRHGHRRHTHEDLPDWRWVALHDRAAVDDKTVWVPLQVGKDPGEDLVDGVAIDGVAVGDQVIAGDEQAADGVVDIEVEAEAGEEGADADAERGDDGNVDRGR